MTTSGDGRSDQPGPGWWLASDGNWYPPDQQPGVAPPPPEPQPPTPPAVPPPTVDGPGGYQAPPPQYPGGWDARVPPPPGPGSGPAHMDFAGFGARLGAWILDTLIVGIPVGVISVVVTLNLPTEITACTVNGRPGLCEGPTTASALLILFLNLGLGALSLFWYYPYFDGVTGATPGKRMIGLRVVDDRTGESIGYGRGLGRSLFKIISGLVLLLGYLWAIWDREKRAWHDMVVSSRVVRSH
ncbi:MAG: RDD family protein [Acidimicrobiales bacterium]